MDDKIFKYVQNNVGAIMSDGGFVSIKYNTNINDEILEIAKLLSEYDITIDLDDNIIVSSISIFLVEYLGDKKELELLIQAKKYNL